MTKLPDTQWRKLAPDPNPVSTPADALNPDWSEDNKVHEWKNYISDEVQAMWSTFTDEQKMALARQADSIADTEEWD